MKSGSVRIVIFLTRRRGVKRGQNTIPMIRFFIAFWHGLQSHRREPEPVSLFGALVEGFGLPSIQSYLVAMGVRPQWFLPLLGFIMILAALRDGSLRQWALKRQGKRR